MSAISHRRRGPRQSSSRSRERDRQFSMLVTDKSMPWQFGFLSIGLYGLLHKILWKRPGTLNLDANNVYWTIKAKNYDKVKKTLTLHSGVYHFTWVLFGSKILFHHVTAGHGHHIFRRKMVVQTFLPRRHRNRYSKTASTLQTNSTCS